MFNVCPKYGEYSVEKPIDASGPFAICPFCGYAHPFLQLPPFYHYWFQWLRQNDDLS
jgi:hypothetical protein